MCPFVSRFRLRAVCRIAVATPFAAIGVIELTGAGHITEHRDFTQAAVVTDLPNEILSALLELPEFRRAYFEDGMTVDEFGSFGATRRTLRQFRFDRRRRLDPLRRIPQNLVRLGERSS